MGTVNWTYVTLHVPFIRAIAAATGVQASNGFVIVAGDGQGGYAVSEDVPELDENVAGYLSVECILMQFLDDAGEVVREVLQDESPLDEGKPVAATFAADVLYDSARLQEAHGAEAAKVIGPMQQAGADHCLQVLVPQQQGAALIAQLLPKKLTVADVPASVQAQIDAEGKGGDSAADPNSKDDLFDD